MGFQGSAPPPDVNVTVEPAAATIENNVSATLPADLTTTNLYGARLFGNGSDGSVVIPAGANVTLTRNMQYVDLTIEAGATLCTAGYAVQVSGTLLNYGTLHNAGGVGSQTSKTAAGVAGRGALAGIFYGGGNGAGTLDGVNSSIGLKPTGWDTPGIVPGGSGGRGGGGYGSATGYAGAPLVPFMALVLADSTTLNSRAYIGGGGGGQGAQGASGSKPAPGGGGGGVVAVLASTLTNSGVISAAGGAGCPGLGTGTEFAGGGGGGGGGVILVVYRAMTGNAPNVAGGVGGLPYGSGEAGVDGAPGRLAEVIVR